MMWWLFLYQRELFKVRFGSGAERKKIFEHIHIRYNKKNKVTVKENAEKFKITFLAVKIIKLNSRLKCYSNILHHK